jgi:hypothetical protein
VARAGQALAPSIIAVPPRPGRVRAPGSASDSAAGHPRSDRAAIATAGRLGPRWQDTRLWSLARTLANSNASRQTYGPSHLVAAELAVARGDYPRAVQALSDRADQQDNWLDRVLLGTLYAKSAGVADAFEEFQVCHVPPKR